MVKLHIHRERSIESLLREHKGIILKVCAMYCRRSSGPRGGAMCEAVPPFIPNTSGTRRGTEWREEVELVAIADGQYTLDLAGRPQAIYLLTLLTADGEKHTVRLIKPKSVIRVYDRLVFVPSRLVTSLAKA